MRYALPIALMTCTSGAFASSPTLGGPMSHLLVTLFNNEIFLTFESPSMSTVTMQDNTGDFVAGASVLNNNGYNGQFGWLANGFISLPPSSGIFVRTLASSPHLSVYEETTFASILGTDGSDDIWRWDGTMTHNWYSRDTPGERQRQHPRGDDLAEEGGVHLAAAIAPAAREGAHEDDGADLAVGRRDGHAEDGGDDDGERRGELDRVRLHKVQPREVGADRADHPPPHHVDAEGDKRAGGRHDPPRRLDG